jgi:hypothetical protein
MQSRISLAELIDSDLPLRTEEAVTILREVCRQYSAGILHGIPNATVIRLTPEGSVVVEGPVSRDQDPVHAAAELLTDVLPGFDAPAGYRVPGGLRLVLARALRRIDLPPFADVAEFCEALARFASPDSRETVRGLFHGWSARRALAPERIAAHELTISDIRRARRATGLTLEDIARGCAVPAWRLRELEWGYLYNWTADERGRAELGSYARAAGLDAALVTSVAWPLLATAAVQPAAGATLPALAGVEWTILPEPPAIAAPIPWPVKPLAPPQRPVVTRHRWALAVAAAILIVSASIGLRPDPPAATLAAAEPRAEAIPAESTAASPTSELTPPIAAPKPARARARPVAYERPSETTRARAAKSRPRPAPPPQHKSFLKRELFRIVFR